MLCDDPLVKAFSSLGYNTVKFPSKAYVPLLVLESDGRREVRGIGQIQSELIGSEPLPSVTRGYPAPDIGLESTRRVSGKVGAEVLQPILAALGVAASVSVELARTSGMRVQLTGVTRDFVAPGDLARYLEGDIEPGSHHVLDVAVRGRLFVVTSVLKSDALRTVVDSSVAEQVAATGVVPQGVSLSVTPGGEESRSKTLTFAGPEPLSFAFQAVRLVYRDGGFMDYATANGLAGYEMPMQTAGRVPDGMLALSESFVEFPDIS